MKVLVGTDDEQHNWTLEKLQRPNDLRYAIDITPQLYFRYVNSKASFDLVQKEITAINDEHWKNISEKEGTDTLLFDVESTLSVEADFPEGMGVIDDAVVDPIINELSPQKAFKVVKENSAK